MTSPLRLSRRHALALAAGAVFATSALPRSAALATTRARVPSRGFNLPGWFDRDDGPAPATATLEKLRQAGFETIRLPVGGDLVSGGDPATLRRIQNGIRDLVGLGFSVVLDMHPAGELVAAFRNDHKAAGEQVLQAWTALRVVVADLPADWVYPELLNEPPMERANWLALREEITATLRASCPLHTLVWGPARFQGIWEIADTPPLADDNQIAAVHYYAPMAFTHQCENWDASPLARIANLPFPAARETPRVNQLLSRLRAAGDEEAANLVEDELSAPWTEARIVSDFADLARWSATHGCPVMLNEFGVLNFCVDAASRVSWARAVREAAEANHVAWTYWELDQGFGFIKSRQSVEGFDGAMIAALLGG
ncbi:endoglucanase [Mesorhizobium sp. M1C.F.Ca.ET.193.01.1.1]|uniref:glycoside hydrolase family 5 protein n=1 Tax=unclassified Mesorhizobium TaxID=325217 RepID=UPI000FD5F795|nr:MULTISPECIES: cellulase family glycosylhydrolase [unclassified Mesorhizobium]TGS98901.1 endoglucanase [bacterium M00.F.Ca.ET.177.01.1.1]TGQ52928.1 endoglucanase [Mesorhizobium sp. M1C.F.Ca.ET.210.01.1.1]TGQ70214.1 endoglucanase [Mesorhizobium sp. M1C.F.Ca.ET.212.01.1.1]TGR06012.1 endoglucanase [Mesorhizobium sp. M1C.F.Ca.ET.204.01.1.1]TGR26751.1 endoglucanase [Mesorhizobium sp. M1C.F.Ca.ET.196.01.1.1]